MKILALTRHEAKCASSRYRTLTYLPYLRENGFEVDVAPLLGDEYLEKRYTGRVPSLLHLVKSYTRRIFRLLQTRAYDLVWIEKEALPWLPYWMEGLLLRNNVKYVLDYDDAVFHRYDDHPYSLFRFAFGKKIGTLMRHSTMVIAGNDYIADYASRAGARVIRHLPSVVDLVKYPPSQPPQNPQLNIGWIGTPITARLLQTIQPALQEVCRDNSAYVTAVGAGDFTLDGVPVVVRPWSEQTEAEEVQKFDVGIMPLSESAFERGKCGLKLIQYMACQRAVVGTPIGVNAKIISHGRNGFHATSMDEWIQAIKFLQTAPEKRAAMGKEGRKTVVDQYSLQVAAPKLADYLREAIGHPVSQSRLRAA